MVSASLSFVLYSSSFYSFPSKSPFDASSVPSIPFPRSLRIAGPLNPRPLLSSLSSSFSSSRRINYPKARVVAKLSAAIDDDSAGAEQFLENNSISAFMRFRRGDGGEGDGGGELQTAVVSYRKKFPWSLLDPFLQVDLVSTIHIADKEYFETLQKGLELYDRVLYEMVTSRDNLENRRYSVSTKRPKTSRSKGFNILGFIQRKMAQILSLDFQLDCLNYEGENWHHADLDYETFKLLQHERGESFFTFAKDMTLKSTKAFVQPASIRDDLGPWRSTLLWASRVLPMPLVGLFIISSICAPLESQTAEKPELEALSRLDFGAAMKIFLAKRLTSEFTAITAALEEKSVIIGERNRAATVALHSAIESGNKRVAVLYGGGHMPDLGRRLREEFDMVPCRVQWITAWSIRNRELDSNSLPFLRTLAKLSGWPLNRSDMSGRWCMVADTESA
ncbi:uncharacterized protein LOC103721540 [Phoenix dactylifera]|uniref:Uncharacterized protein LOC103721540 n=1 Tax=Phoenix dactylifera TaxID=42345 RepID=A0A8B8ZHF9_PHODC|nr:uncharacterized protein LOC103721540 [Phoenix dactylifera]